MSKKRIRARVMFSDESMRDTTYLPLFLIRREAEAMDTKSLYEKPKRHFVIPATADAYAQMVQQIIATPVTITRLAGAGYVEDEIFFSDRQARAALRAIGITPPKEGRK